jgi:uncharacterized protein
MLAANIHAACAGRRDCHGLKFDCGEESRTMSTPSITDNAALQRYEMVLDASLGGGKGGGPGVGLAFVVYRRVDNVLALEHAEVPAALEGQGIGARLVQATLDDIRARGLKVVPRCSFVRAFMRRHPEYNDLMVE